MRLALQATFMSADLSDSSEESRTRRETIDQALRRDGRSVEFFRRLRTAIARKDLKAPDVFAEESFPDANIVAQYLDGVDIPAEVAAEYEKVCWDSPEILAEAGVCYDFLTNSLSRPFEPPKNCRRRLYYIAWEDAARSAALTSNAKASPGTRSNDLAEFSASPRVDGSWRESEKERAVEAPASGVGSPSTRRGEISQTLKADRKAKRRGRRLAIAAFALCGLAGASYFRLIDWGAFVRWERSPSASAPSDEALALSANSVAAATRDLAEAESPLEVDSESLGVRPAPLRPLTVFHADAAKAETIDSDEYARLIERGIEQETVAPTNDERAAADAASPRLASNAFENEKNRGLGANWAKRGGLVIPAKNNDVFSATARY